MIRARERATVVIEASCPACNKRHLFADEQAGQQVACKGCSARFLLDLGEESGATSVAVERETTVKPLPRFTEPPRPVAVCQLELVEGLLKGTRMALGGGHDLVVSQERIEIDGLRIASAWAWIVGKWARSLASLAGMGLTLWACNGLLGLELDAIPLALGGFATFFTFLTGGLDHQVRRRLSPELGPIRIPMDDVPEFWMWSDFIEIADPKDSSSTIDLKIAYLAFQTRRGDRFQFGFPAMRVDGWSPLPGVMTNLNFSVVFDDLGDVLAARARRRKPPS